MARYSRHIQSASLSFICALVLVLMLRIFNDPFIPSSLSKASRRPIDITNIYQLYDQPYITIGGEVAEDPVLFSQGYNKSKFIHDLKYIIEEPNICKRSPDIEVIAYVHSAFTKKDNRELIRNSWGSSRYYNRTKLRVLFVFGAAISPHEQKLINEESRKFKDIIQTDFVDSYRNLSYKGVSALKWISQHCPEATWILKSDDDMIINSIALLTYLHTIQRHHKQLYDKQMTELVDLYKQNSSLALARINSHNWKNETKPKSKSKKQRFLLKKRFDKILCAVWFGMPVLRGKGCAKWCVSESDWPYKSYPSYCSGSAFIIPRHLAPRLYKSYFKSRFLWVDDAYISGVLPKTAGIMHHPIHSLYELNHHLIQRNMLSGNRLFCHHPGKSKDRSKWWPLLVEKEERYE